MTPILAEMREILTASSAAGVAVAFGSPIGGVLFALEEMTTHFPNRTMWKSFFCAMIATIVLQAMDPFRTGKLVMFQVSYDREWHFFEYLFVVIIGLFGVSTLVCCDRRLSRVIRGYMVLLSSSII